MIVRRLPLLGLVAVLAFLVCRAPGALNAAQGRISAAWRQRALGRDEALALYRGLRYVSAIESIRTALPVDSEYLLLDAADGADVFVRFDLAPRRAHFGGQPKDLAFNVTLEKLSGLPEWTVVPRLEGEGPRLFPTRLLAERGSIP